MVETAPERTTDLLTCPKSDRVLMPDVNVSLLSLISAVGVEGSLKHECGTNVLDFLMKDTSGIVNDQGVSNIFSTLIQTNFDESFFQMVFENLLKYFLTHLLRTISHSWNDCLCATA